jgi:F-type H+-transporting ATPase subunit delta
MNIGLISARFAKALYDYSSSAGEEDIVMGELNLLFDIINNIQELNDSLNSPIVSYESKLNLLITATGGNPSDSCRRFFQMLLNHRREYMIDDICVKYRQVYETEKNILRVRLTTAVPLDNQRTNTLHNKLENATGKKINLTHVVQPDIIGGFVLTTDEKRLDASVKTRLQDIRKKLTL